MPLAERLMASPAGTPGLDPDDRRAVAGLLARAVEDMTAEGHSLPGALGLAPADLAALVARWFPQAPDLTKALAAGGSPDPEAPEEADLRALLLSGAPGGAAACSDDTRWMAAMVARRCQRPNHLWQDMGLPGREALSALLHRHFPALAARNDRDMKWKKFFYRELCTMEGLSLCKAPVCDACTDFAVCFGPET